MSKTYEETKAGWVKWLGDYGIDRFYDHFMANAQGARSTCAYCGEAIHLDIAEGGGVADWCLEDGDYGCIDSPDTCEDGCGSHMPERDERLVREYATP